MSETAGRARRGRPPRHSKAAVAAEAVALADAEGLAAVTMRAVAARLGTAVMSLYSYVPDKQSLVHEMVDLVAREQHYPEPTGDWRADLHRLAHLQRELVLRHPWLLDAVSRTQPLSEGTLAWLEHGLGALEPLAMPAPVALETLALMTGAVLNLVRSQLDVAPAADAHRPAAPPQTAPPQTAPPQTAPPQTAPQQAAPQQADPPQAAPQQADPPQAAPQQADPPQAAPQQADPRYAELGRLLATGRFPRFAAALPSAVPAAGEPDLAAEFDRLLDRFLDGFIPSGQRPGA